jgi:PAS domain S-box-containing protein
MSGEAHYAQVAIEQEAASIVASSHDAIIGITAWGAIGSCNPAAARLYGYVPGEIVGQPADMLVPPGLRAAEAAVLQQIMAGEEVEPYRTDRLCHDGSVVTVSVAISPIADPDGTIVGASTVSRRASDVRDVRDRIEARVHRQRADVRDAEDRFEAGVDAERVRERVQVDASERRFQAGMDVERAKERIQVQDAEDRFQVRMEAERARERVQVQDAADRFQVGLADGRTRERAEVQEAEDRFQVGMDAERARERAEVQDAEDRFQVGIDIERAEARSDRRRLEAQLQQGQRLEILGQLAGGVAHDFNNLLAVILNYAAFVSDELTAGPRSDVAAAARDVAQIQRAAERAAALTHQLLAFARREVVQPRVLDLNHVVRDVEELLSRTIGEDVMLRTELGADLWPVLMDPGQVEQVLMNIAVNARDAMTGGGALRIDTANVAVDADPSAASPAPTGRYVRLRIADTGAGMSADVLDRVFEPFYTTKAEGAGTGLGLATVYGIVTQAGGTIAIRSKPGAGTTIKIMIPATDEIAGPVPEVAADDPTPGGETVLVVEDDEALRAVTERIFVQNGYRVITAADGVAAVAAAGAYDGDIHLLVTDVVMPKMLGNEVAERIRRIKPEVDVLYMSGYAQQNLVAQSSLDRDVHLVEKPFSVATLIGTAGQILGGRRKAPAAVGPDEPAASTGSTPAAGTDLPGDRT